MPLTAHRSSAPPQQPSAAPALSSFSPLPHLRQVYFFPPSVPSADGPPVVLMYQPGGVLNVTAAARDVRITNMSIVNGRHAGILAE